MTRRVLRRDEEWRGEVLLDADAFVPLGRRLSLAPGCRVSAAPGTSPVILVEGELVARGAPGAEVVLAVPVETAGGALDMSRCACSGRPIAVNAGHGRHRLEEVTFLAAPTGLAVHHGEAALRGVSARGCGTAAFVTAGGRLDWDGGSVEDGELGVHAAHGTARLSGLRLTRLREGLRLERGAAEARGLTARGLAGPAVGVHGPAFALLDGVDAGAGAA
ncbi:MAG: hypothetical protein SF051_09210, partial [Elusimicrobiota bacterium]|nr:hypothetical protein [Elusimicrobiota bacterium]